MTDTKSSWNEVGAQLNELGLKLQLHFEQAAAEGRADEDKVKDALRSVGDAVEQAFAALGAVAKDDAVREDIKDVGARCATPSTPRSPSSVSASGRWSSPSDHRIRGVGPRVPSRPCPAVPRARPDIVGSRPRRGLGSAA